MASERTQGNSFNPWWKGHYDGSAVRFTPEPNSVLEATIAAEEFGGYRRALAWIQRWSTGQHSDQVVDAKGNRMGVQACAAAIGMDKGQVSRLFAELEDDQEVLLQGQKVFRILRGCKCEECEGRRKTASRNTESRSKVAHVRNFQPFLLVRNEEFRKWLEKAYPTKAAQVQTAAELERKAKEALEAAALEEVAEAWQARESGSKSVSNASTEAPKVADVRNFPERDAPKRPAKSNGVQRPATRLEEIRACLIEECRGAAGSPGDALIGKIDALLGDAPIAELRAKIRERWPALSKRSYGIAQPFAEEVGARWLQKRRQEVAAAAVEQGARAIQADAYDAAVAEEARRQAATERYQLLSAAERAELHRAARKVLAQHLSADRIAQLPPHEIEHQAVLVFMQRSTTIRGSNGKHQEVRNPVEGGGSGARRGTLQHVDLPAGGDRLPAGLARAAERPVGSAAGD
jgi:hypothetical protein